MAAVQPEVSAQTGLQEVLVTPDEGRPVEPPGLTVRGELEIGSFSGAVLVPERAIVRNEDRTTVVVAGEDSRAHVVRCACSDATGDWPRSRAR